MAPNLRSGNKLITIAKSNKQPSNQPTKTTKKHNKLENKHKHNLKLWEKYIQIYKLNHQKITTINNFKWTSTLHMSLGPKSIGTVPNNTAELKASNSWAKADPFG